MKEIQDPITGNTKVKFVKEINVNKLILGYKKVFDIDVKQLLFEDSVSLLESTQIGYQFYYPPLLGDDLFYQALENFPWYYAKNKWEHIIGQKLINHGDTLEVGCGNGEFLNKIKEKGIDSIGLDFNKSAVNNAREKGVEAYSHTLAEFIETHPNKKFDNIVLFQILEHIYDVGNFFKDVVKLLNSKGQIIIAVPNNDSFVFNPMDSSSYHLDAHLLNMPPHHAGKWNKKSLTKLARHLNLQVDAVFYEPIYEVRIQLIADNIMKRYFPIFRNNTFVKRKVLEFVTTHKNKFRGDSILISMTKI